MKLNIHVHVLLKFTYLTYEYIHTWGILCISEELLTVQIKGWLILLEQHKKFTIYVMLVTSENDNTINLSPILPDPLLPTRWSTPP